MSVESFHKKNFFKELEIEVKKFHHKHVIKTTFFERLKDHAEMMALDWDEEIIEAVDILPKAIIAIKGVIKPRG